MELALALLASFVEVGTAPAPIAQELALVRTESDGSGKEAVFASHPLDATFTTAGTPSISLDSLTSLGGGKKLLFVFAGEFDGKPGDEIVVVREKPTQKKVDGVPTGTKVGRLDVDVFSAPTQIGAKKTKLLASFAKDAIGFTVGDERVTSVCAVDHDGDGRDDLAILRTYNDGRQSLTIHPVALTKDQDLAEEVASAPEIGWVGAGEVLDVARVKSLFGGDLLVLRRLDASGEHIELRAAPETVAGGVGALLSSYDGVDTADDTVFDGLSTMSLPHLGSPFPDYVIVVMRKLVDGGRRVELAPLPLAIGEEYPALTSLQLSATNVGTGKGLVSAFGFRRFGG